MAVVRFETNAGSIIQVTRDLDLALAGVAVLGAEIESRGRVLLREVFQTGLQQANAFGGFPEQFQDHVLRVLDNIEVRDTSGAAFISVEFLFDNLGDWNDLPQAFHQGARLPNGDIVWGPYEGEQLAQEDPNIRYVFWYNLDDDKWQETIAKRIEIWGDIAPEWLYAQFGQTDWEPIVPPTAMLEEFEAQFNALANQMTQAYIETAVSIANGYETQGISATPIYRNGRVTETRLLSGVNAGIGPSGRPRQAGQYFPLP